MSIEIKQYPAHSANQGSRFGSPIDMIILHSTEGSAAGALSWFAMAQAKVSAHFVVGIDGRVYQCVPFTRCAWHAGHPVYNRRSIGIEMEAVSITDRIPDFLDAQMVALTNLIRWLAPQFPDLKINGNQIIGHNEVPNPSAPGKFGGYGGHVDPGPKFPWLSLMIALHYGTAYRNMEMP